MAEVQSFKLLKIKRQSLRTAVTKVVNELEAELSNSDLNVDRLCELVEILCIKFEPLTLIDQQMEPLFKPEEFDGEFEIAEKYREKVLLWQFRAKKKINEFSKPRVTSSSLQTTLSQSQDEHFRNSDNIRIKVPKYHITRFYGDDASKWLTFWNSFETAVHNNESLNKVDKFNYLKAHLGGSALNTVEGFPISAKAYDETVDLLKKRFANPEILIQAHMNKILSLQPLKNSNDLRSFRKFVDNCNVQLRSLNSLGVPSANYGKILCPMLLKLIPSDLVLDYHKLQQKDSGSDIQQLLSEKISDLWELDSLGIKDFSEKKSKLELQDLALKHFENMVLRDDEGRLIDYEQVFVDWEKEGIIEKIAQDEPKIGGKFHYLSHRPVFKENSTTKICPVFDGSAHHGKSCSLNDCVEKGLNWIEMIPAILNRFLLGKKGVISDIRKAFLQISFHENDMNFLPLLWWEGGNSEKAVIYRHRRVVLKFLAVPFISGRLNHHFKQAPEHLEKAAEKLIDSMFVDNCVASVDSSEELESFQRDSRELLALGKFDLRGWRHSDIESNFDFQDNQQKSDPEEIIVLRLMWNVKESPSLTEKQNRKKSQKEEFFHWLIDILNR
ncbi:integrase catalytic domain-containing protein [Trichonephila clavipes]|nr:integrase catalytic domain-containing protein [Trichonephila clavipes]